MNLRSLLVFFSIAMFCLPAVRAGDKNTDSSTTKKSRKMNFKTQIISFAPLQTTEQGIGVSVGYEMGLDKKGLLALSLPAAVSFSTGNSPYANLMSPQGYGNLKRDIIGSKMFYFCPGIKFYPTSCFGKVKFAFGPSLVMAYAGQERNPVTQLHENEFTTTGPLVLGFMIANSLNISPTQHFYLAFDFGLGATYLTPRSGQDSSVISSLSQFAFKLGYRF